MGLFTRIKSLFFGKKETTNEIVISNVRTKEIVDKKEFVPGYSNIWQYISPKENTQAEHLLGVINFDEWIDMDEIRKRIKEKFFIEYKHEKSLYPYVKTLVDIGLIESNSVGGKRKWRKKELIIRGPPIIKIEKQL